MRKFQTFLHYFSLFLSSQLCISKNAMRLITHKSICKSYINVILSNIPDRPNYLASWQHNIAQLKHGYLKYLWDLLKALSTWVTLFHYRQESLYQTIKTRLKAIWKLKPPKTRKYCKPFARVIDYWAFLEKTSVMQDPNPKCIQNFRWGVPPW